jgi:hypothetical protein
LGYLGLKKYVLISGLGQFFPGNKNKFSDVKKSWMFSINILYVLYLRKLFGFVELCLMELSEPRKL